MYDDITWRTIVAVAARTAVVASRITEVWPSRTAYYLNNGASWLVKSILPGRQMSGGTTSGVAWRP